MNEKTIVRKTSDDHYYGFTRSVCSKCNKIIDAQIIENKNNVYFDKLCPIHGRERVLISTDFEWYNYCRTYIRDISLPLKLDGVIKGGCPNDCGICGRHRQHTSIIMFGITNMCNLKCPICLVTNEDNWTMPLEDAKRLIDKAVENEGTLEILSISGGEPTLNPDIIDIIRYANEHGVVRCCMSSNGVRIAEDEEFVRQLSTVDVFVNLQFDGFRKETYKKIRGDERMLEVKRRALRNLKKYNVKTVLIPTIVKGLNDDEIGKIFDFALKERFISSLHIQTLTHTGVGSDFEYDLMDHITVSDVLRNIEAHFNGDISKYDFVPEPNECFLTGVFLRFPNMPAVPIYRFVNMTKYLNKIQNNQLLTLEEIDEMSKKITMSLLFGKEKNLGLIINRKFIKPLLLLSEKINECKKNCGSKIEAERKIAKLMESCMLLVNFHTMMDRYTFDQKRVMECTHNWITDDEKIYPFCNYSLFHCRNIKNNLEKKDTPAVRKATQQSITLKNKYNLDNL